MARRGWVCVLAAGCLACAIDRTGLGAADGATPPNDGWTSPRDVSRPPPSDSGPPGEADADAQPPDAGAGPSDAGSPDAGPDPSDAGTDGGPPGCDAMYPRAPSDLLCVETASECEISALLSGRTCNDYCEGFGGRCLRGYAGAVGSCAREGPGACDAARTDHLCVCSRGP